MSSEETLVVEFRRQVSLFRSLGQVEMLRIIVQEFRTPAARPKAEWPPADIETRTDDAK